MNRRKTSLGGKAKGKGVLILCIVFAGMLVFSASAEGLAFGIKGGLGHFSFYGSEYRENVLDDPDLSNGLKLGLVAGFFATFPISDFLSIQPELLIAMQGDKTREDASLYGPYDGYAKLTQNIPYLSVPVLFNLHMGKLSIFAGPDVLIKIGSGEMKMTATDDALDAFIGCSVDFLADDVENFGLAAVAGLALPVSFGATRILFDARFQLGFTNVLNEAYWIELKQYGIIIMAGYQFKAAGMR